MKKIFLLLTMTCTTVLCSYNNLLAKPYKIPPGTTVHTKSPPCDFKVTGTVNLEGNWGWPPVVITGYDITISGPCGTIHFQGLVTPSPTGNGLLGWQMNAYDVNNQPIPISTIDPDIIQGVKNTVQQTLSSLPIE